MYNSLSILTIRRKLLTLKFSLYRTISIHLRIQDLLTKDLFIFITSTAIDINLVVWHSGLQNQRSYFENLTRYGNEFSSKIVGRLRFNVNGCLTGKNNFIRSTLMNDLISNHENKYLINCIQNC